MDLCWLEGGPFDGEVVECEPSPRIVLPLIVGTEGQFKAAQVFYRRVSEHEDGVQYLYRTTDTGV